MRVDQCQFGCRCGHKAAGVRSVPASTRRRFVRVRWHALALFAQEIRSIVAAEHHPEGRAKHFGSAVPVANCWRTAFRADKMRLP